MANVFRYRYGDMKPVQMAVDSATVIEIGDLLYLNTDDAKNAGAQTDQTSEAANQRLFAQNFLGVAMQQSRSGDDDPITVATAGVFEFATASASYEVGALVGVDEAGSGTALEDQVVAAVAGEDLAIGKVAKTAASSTTVLVDIKSRVMAGITGGAYIPTAAMQTLVAGGGAVNVTSYYTAGASDAGGDAWTLANGLVPGQLKKITLITDGGGNAVLTPTALSGGTTITFADAGDFCLLMWTGAAWVAIELGNDADGATAPALA